MTLMGSENIFVDKPRLRLESGRFVLRHAPRAIKEKLAKDSYWQEIIRGTGNFGTSSLKAAAVFRKWATPNVETVLRQAFQEHYAIPSLPPLPWLDAHQVEGINWILSRKRSYLAHAPGAGKTAQALVAALLSDPNQEGQALFIVPPSLVENWRREIEKVLGWLGAGHVWCPRPTIGIVKDSKHQRSVDWFAQFIICPDSMLPRDWVQAAIEDVMNIRFIAVDEASRMKEPLSERSLSFYGGRTKGAAFRGVYQDAKHVVFMDGSPMPNRPMELWAPTYALHPEAIDYMSQDDFGYRYCGPKVNERGQYTFLHSSHEAELKEKLQKDFMHVVTEAELTHPERLRSMLFMNEDVRSPEHKTWERKNLTRIELSEETSQGDLARFRRELGIKKIPFISDYVFDKLENKNEQVLLFAWHREVCIKLAEILAEFKPGLVIGGTGVGEREEYFERFQQGKCKLIIGNIQAMGRGHNLQRADRVIFGEFSWTDELNKQCEKRASRRGNESLFTRCEYIVAPDSMDEKVLSAIFTKQKRVERVIG